ncbi:MAG TPA: 6-phosphogluconolactonase [bacterium]|nr:6-phosphogluconolactonase [bacterium]
MRPDIRISADGDRLARDVARAIVERLNQPLVPGGSRSLCLAGGQTPRDLYQVLATEYRDTIPWPRLHLFWGDERYVPPDDAQSNYRLVRESLLDHVPIPKENVHPMPTNLPDPNDAAAAYEQTLRERLSPPWPRFDLVLLGMGSDGHTASLFPGSPALAERTRWVATSRASVEPRVRLTLTLPVLNRAALVFFLVAGAEKADILRRVLAGPSEPVPYPAAAVRPEDGRVVWWVDQQAARSLP